MKRFLSLILVIALMAACMIPAAAARVYADEAPLSRKEVAVIIADLLNVEFEPYMAEEVSIADVTPDIDGYEAIILCVYLEIMGGYPDGCFKPERMLTRAELAVFLCNAAEVDTADLVYEPRPMDVPEGAWYYQWMSGVLQNGFMSVDSNGCFRPDQTAYLSDINMTTLRKVMSAEFLFDAATGTITGYRGKDSIVTILNKSDNL